MAQPPRARPRGVVRKHAPALARARRRDNRARLASRFAIRPRCGIDRASELLFTGHIGTLLAHGASLSARDYADKTPLHFAIREGGDEAVKILLAAGCDPNAQDKYERPPLVAAAMNGCLEIAARLLAAGAQVDLADQNGYAPIHGAAQNGDYEMVKLLMCQGPEQGPTRNGHTPRQLAERHAAPGVVALFESASLPSH